MSVSSDDQTYVVTIAASGIGAATTHYLRKRRGRLIVCDLRDADVIGDLITTEGRAAFRDPQEIVARRRFEASVLCR